MPSFSIITITYNAEKYLERTIKSIENQTVKDFEYILIDGGSSDGTLDIASNYSNLFSKVISEKDNGLYDAMNKGLENIKGDFVWFVNAGDEITEKNAIEKLQKLLIQNPDIIYGETNFTSNEGVILGIRSELTPHKLPENLSWKQMKFGMLVCHQSFIVKREIASKYLLDNLSADIDWEINALKKAKTILKYDGILSNYLIGGVSNQQLKKSLLDRYKVLNYHFGFLQNLLNHLVIFLRGLKKMFFVKGKYW